MKVVYFVAGAYSFLAYRSRNQILVIKLGERRYRKKFTRKCLPYLPGELCETINLESRIYCLDPFGNQDPEVITYSYPLNDIIQLMRLYLIKKGVINFLHFIRPYSLIYDE
jgi:hypothetical protein